MSDSDLQGGLVWADGIRRMGDGSKTTNDFCVLALADEVLRLRSTLTQSQEQVKALILERDAALENWHSHQKNVPCSGCEGGHDTFWKTVIESPQWQEWERYTKEWDVLECSACGHISSKHFQAFLKFVVDRVKAEARFKK